MDRVEAFSIPGDGYQSLLKPNSGYRVRRGLSIPAITVLDPLSRVIEDQQRAVFRFNAQHGSGADIIFAAGTTGEWNRIANRERQRLIEIQSDEIEHINAQISGAGGQSIEGWVGVTAETARDTLQNLKHAVRARAHAAVIAPLSIGDAGDIVAFFQRHVSDVFDAEGRTMPVFLYDNANIAVKKSARHIHTRDVKRLSRLPFISGIKVSAPRRVLGNYTKGALHYKDRSEFGVYIGDAMLMFRVFRLDDGLAGRIREYWNRYLLHNELPVGVVSGPANLLPREWQRAFRACFADHKSLMEVYRREFASFGEACTFDGTDKSIACIKHGLKMLGVLESDRVADGTPALGDKEKQSFARAYGVIRRNLAEKTSPIWISQG